MWYSGHGRLMFFSGELYLYALKGLYTMMRVKDVAAAVSVRNGLRQSLHRLHQPALSDSNLRVPDFEVLHLLVCYVSGGQNLPFFHLTQSLHISHNLSALRFSNLHHLALR